MGVEERRRGIRSGVCGGGWTELEEARGEVKIKKKKSFKFFIPFLVFLLPSSPPAIVLSSLAVICIDSPTMFDLDLSAYQKLHVSISKWWHCCVLEIRPRSQKLE